MICCYIIPLYIDILLNNIVYYSNIVEYNILVFRDVILSFPMPTKIDIEIVSVPVVVYVVSFPKRCSIGFSFFYHFRIPRFGSGFCVHHPDNIASYFSEGVHNIFS